MRIQRLLIVGTSLALLASGCQSDTGTGALIGTGVGAVAGAIIGNNMGGHETTGALVGAGVGAGTGALIGAASDNHKRQRRNAYDTGYYEGTRDARSGYDEPRSSQHAAPAPRRSSDPSLIPPGGSNDPRLSASPSVHALTYNSDESMTHQPLSSRSRCGLYRRQHLVWFGAAAPCAG